ncbi:MAG: FtsX-like permease family protein [Bacteroidota bacterium]|nr:FtsX-like permease family protein [Bacteroidota bacterium]
MIRNYLLIALRNLWRNKLITGINLVGMAIGFGIFLTLLSWVRFDASFDKFHKDIEQMYVLNIRFTLNGSEYTSQRTGGAYGRVLPELFPQVRSACRVSQPREFELGIPLEGKDSTDVMKYFDESGVIMVDSNFFNFFTFPLISGNKEDIFSEIDHIVITETLAEKLFGEEEALNRQIKIGEGGYFTVIAVAADPPVESTYQFNALLGFHIMEELGYPVNEYGGTIYFNNFKLSAGTDLVALNESINKHVEENLDEDFDTWFFMDRFDRIHLHDENKGMIGFLMNLILSVVILLIACINFINLTTANSSLRLKEIAIRKSAGAGKKQLVIQFLGESYLMLLVAFYLGFFIAEHLAPLSYRSFGVSQEQTSRDLAYWLKILVIYLVTGLLAGLYPSLKIAGYKPLAYFTGKGNRNQLTGRRSRRVLIVLQFAFSIFFITVSIFTIRQFDYLREADLGFNREDVLYIRTKGQAWDKYPVIKQELEQLSFVKGVSSASDIPVEVNFGEIDWGERDGEHNKFARVIRTNADFLSTFEIDLLEGEYYTQERDTLNYSYVVVSHSLIEWMGWEDPVGREMYLWGDDRIILGVTEDINFFPFNLATFGGEALIYVYEPVQQYLFVRVTTGTSAEQLSAIGEVFQEYNPGYELEYDFVSNFEYPALENSEGIKLIFRIFSAVAIFIAIMGLIGLSQFNNTRRTKEVGIHKVMGAQTGSVVNLLLSEFMKLVVLSNLVALPLAYLALWKLFQFFNYSIKLKITVFVAVFVLSVLFSLFTVIFQAWRTARANPVDSLRYE